MPEAPVLARWQADRTVYIRDSLWLAAACMIGATALLYLIGNKDYWVGAIGAFLAVAARNGYLASEELAAVWELHPDTVQGPNDRFVNLDEIAKVRKLGSAVQIITHSGQKILMKYLSDPDSARARISSAAGLAP